MKTHITAPDGDLYWRYEMPEHQGAKMLLLTKGGVLVTGRWLGDYCEHYIAWCPMPRRDKARERELRL